MPVTLPIEKTSLRISTPYNHEPDWVREVLEPFSSVISEVYLPVHALVAHSGRPWRGPSRQDEYDARVDELAAALKDQNPESRIQNPEGAPSDLQYGTTHPRPKGVAAWHTTSQNPESRIRKIPLNFVANDPIALPSRRAAVVNEFLRLDERYPGSIFTVADFETAVQVHEIRPTLDVQPSTLSRINGPTAAWYWRQFAGSRGVTLDRSINRRPDLIRAIRKLGLGIRMVVNDDCLPECPSTSSHIMDIQLADELGFSRGGSKALSACGQCRPAIDHLKRTHLWLVAQKDVLPFSLHHLEGLVDQVKIAGREATTAELARAMLDYSTMEKDSNSMYQEPSEAWARIATCDRVCELCRWCMEHIKARTPSPE
jgi:hypothetical protein